MKNRFGKKVLAAGAMGAVLLSTVGAAPQTPPPLPQYPITANFEWPELTAEQVRAPSETLISSDGRVSLSLAVTRDGSGHGTTNGCFVSSENGFPIGDDSPTDGVACIGDTVGYRLSFNVAPSEVETTVRVNVKTVINEHIEVGRSGDGLEAEEASFSKLCAEGAAYGFTGTMDGGDCVMTFAPSQESRSLASTEITSQVSSWINLPGQWDYYSHSGMTKTGVLTVDGESTQTPQPTLMVSASRHDVSLNKSLTYSFIEVDGKVYVGRDVIVRQNATKVSSPPPKGEFRLHLLDYSGTIQFEGGIPDGALIQYEDGSFVTEVDYEAGTVSFDNSSSTSRFGSDRDVRFKVLTPLEFRETEDELRMFISDLQVRPLYEARGEWQPLSTDVGLTYPQAWMGSEYDPGLGQPAGYNTAASDQGFRSGGGLPNNNWATIPVEWTVDGNFTKTIAYSPDRDGERERIHYPFGVNTDPDIWVSLQASSNGPLPLDDVLMCDMWDPAHQSVDTEREVTALQWSSGDSALAATPYTIEYGVSDRTGVTTNNNVATALEYQSECGGEGVVWSDTPSEDTNVLRVSLSEGTVGPTTGGLLVDVKVPFQINPDGSVYENFPMPSYVRDAAVFSNAGSWLDLIVNRNFQVEGSWMNPRLAGDQTLAAQTAGAKSHVNIFPHSFNNRENQVLEGDDLAYRGEQRITVDSAALSPELVLGGYSRWNDELGGMEYSPGPAYEVVSVTPADVGSDGIPGTDDDVSDWVFHIRLVGEDLHRSDPDGNGTWNLDNLARVNYQIPSYLQDGDSLSITQQLLNVDEIPGNRTEDDQRTITVPVASPSEVSQTKVVHSPREMVGDEVGFTTIWSNNTEAIQSDLILTDVLPYNGDGRGTKMTEPWSNVRVVPGGTDADYEDVMFQVTDAEPSSVEQDPDSVTWVALGADGKHPSGKEITGVRVIEDDFEVDNPKSFQILADTDGMSDGDAMVNSMDPATVGSMSLQIPATSPVKVELYTTAISGTVWYDTDADGVIDDDEQVRFPGATVTVTDSEGNVVGEVVTDENGDYSVEDLPLGDYTVTITDEGGNIISEWEQTTDPEHSASLTENDPKVTDLDFGYVGDPGQLEVSKSIRDLDEGQTVNHGEVRVFEFVVTNTGGWPVRDVVITDSVFGQIGTIEVIEPGESVTLTHEAVPTVTA